MKYTMRPWWRVDDCARLLRVNKKTIYGAIRDGSLPAKKAGPYYVIPCEALGFTAHPATKSREYHVNDDAEQLVLDLDPACLIPIRRYRDGSPKNPWDFDNAQWRVTV